jgi:uncharacterized membrane protein HdeD (DUF308 family)
MIAHALLTEIEAVRRNWGWFLVLGIALIVLGIVALWAVGLTTLATVLFLGWLLIFSGVFEAIAAFWARRWSGFFLHLLAGILTVVVGVLVVGHPIGAAAGLTLLLAALFLTGGVFRIISAVALRFPGWGWAVLDGVISLLLGAMIWSDWPFSGSWVIGTFVGIALVFRGWAWVMFALAVRRLPQLGDFTRQSAGGERVSTPV